MLVSIALAPGVLNPPAAHSPAQLRALASVLRAVAQNGIVVSPDLVQFKSELLGAAAAATGPVAQRFTPLAEDLAKNLHRYAISREGAPSINDAFAQCAETARWGHCDAVVVLNEADRQRCADVGLRLDRTVLLEEFADSTIDHTRSGWLSSQRLDKLALPDSISIVGRALRFSKSVVVADKMIGVSMKHGKDTPFHRAERVAQHLAGLLFLVKAWKQASPLAQQASLDAEVVTVAGGSGARGGFIDPTILRTAINTAAANLGLYREVGKLRITVKSDGEPPVFNYRLMSCGGRVWGLQHGLDDFGRLVKETDRRPTILDPSSDALDSVFREIRALPDL
jgi:hypothetical protein